MSARYRNALNEGVQAIHAEGAGAIKLSVVMPYDAVGLLLNAVDGDAESTTLLRAVTQAQAGIDAAPLRRPMLCVACPAALRGTEHAFVVVTPAVPAPVHAMAFAVCSRCGTSPAVVGVKGFEAARKFWPDLREAVLAPGGRA